jgi:hypothetical protein
LSQARLDFVLDRIVQRTQASGFQEMPQFMQGHGGMEDDVREGCGYEGFGAQENETKHFGPRSRFTWNGQDRGDEGGVEGNQDMVGDDPAFLQQGTFYPSRARVVNVGRRTHLTRAS